MASPVPLVGHNLVFGLSKAASQQNNFNFEVELCGVELLQHEAELLQHESNFTNQL